VIWRGQRTAPEVNESRPEVAVFQVDRRIVLSLFGVRFAMDGLIRIASWKEFQEFAIKRKSDEERIDAFEVLLW
jgi:hypothetical protein